MNIFPKFLYLFQAVPIAIPRNFFRNIQTLFTKFIWVHRHPRIRRTLLSLPKQYGGLAVPDMYKYYQAVHLGRLLDWCQHGDLKIWPGLEQAQSRELLHRAPWCFRDLASNTKLHPTIGPTLHICYNLSKGKLSTQDSPLVPILGNPQFILGIQKGPFEVLIKR